MSAPYLIGDERAFQDFLTNANAVPVGGVAPGAEPTSKNAIVAALSAIANTETLIINIPIIAAQTLQPGSIVRFRVQGTLTTANNAAGTFRLRAGILGTTADASVMTLGTGTGGTTASSDPVFIQIDFVVRTLGASGTGSGTLLVNELTANGFGASQVVVATGTSSTLATTTATFVDLTFISGNSGNSLTVQQASAEIIS